MKKDVTGWGLNSFLSNTDPAIWNNPNLQYDYKKSLIVSYKYDNQINSILIKDIIILK